MHRDAFRSTSVNVQRLLLVLLILLLTPLPGKAQDTGATEILKAIDETLKMADNAFFAKFTTEDEWQTNIDDALKSYQAALGLVNQHKAEAIFSQEPDATTLSIAEYRALAGKGRIGARQLQKFSSPYYEYVDLPATSNGIPDVRTVTEADTQPIRDDLEAAVKIGESFAEPPFELEWVYYSWGLVLFEYPSQHTLSFTLSDASDANKYLAYQVYEKAGTLFRTKQAFGVLIDVYDIRAYIATYFALTARQASDGKAIGMTAIEWWKHTITNYRNEFFVIVNGQQYPYGNVNYCDESLTYSIGIENGMFPDPDGLTLRQLLEQQAEDYQYCATSFYLPIAQARLAWLNQDSDLAKLALANPNILPETKQFWSPISHPVLYLEHALGRAAILAGNPVQALALLGSAKQLVLDHPNISWGYSGTSTEIEAGRFPTSQIGYVNEWLIGKALVQVGRYREGIAQLQGLTTLVPDYAANDLYPGSQLDLGAALIGLNRYNDAIAPLDNARHYYRQQLDTAMQASDTNTTKVARLGLIDATLRLSLPLAILGRTEEAITSLQEAVDEANKTDNALLKVNTTLRVGDIYQQLQKDDDALRNYQAAADLATSEKLPQQQVQALLGVGQILVRQGQTDDARKALTMAAAAAKAVDEAKGQVSALNSLGDLALVGDKPDARSAQKFYEQALNVATASNNPRLAIQPLMAIGDLQASTTPTLARLTYYRALTNALLIDDREAQAHLYARFGQLANLGSDASSADAAYQNALGIIEQTARGFKSESLTSQFAANYAPIYADYLNVLFRQQRFAEAFTVSEQARARAFLDQLAAGPVDYRKGASADLLQKSDDLRLELDKLRELQAQTEADVALSDEQRAQTLTALKQQIQEREREYVEVFTRLQAASPELSTLDSVQTLTVPQVQALLDPDTTLISYYTLATTSYAFVITANGVDCIALPVGQDQLAQWVRLFRDDETQGRGLQELGNAIITPLVAKIKTSHVVIVPRNVLNYVPFVAIPLADGGLFGQKFVLSYLPSASTLAYLAQSPAQPGKLLALGNPTDTSAAPLKFADKEVQDVSSLLSGDAFTGSEATLQRLLNQASDAGVLYIAAHGTFNQRAPLFSALHLTASGNDDGLLEAYEIYSLDLTKKTELVVLSACETGIGGLTEGDEFSGLNRAFLYAGSPAVISTLWSVDDQATGLLMTKFFEMRKQGQANAQAIQSAQEYIRTYQENGQTPYASPYFWAGFILTGRG